jgi:hypothetical protein
MTETRKLNSTKMYIHHRISGTVLPSDSRESTRTGLQSVLNFMLGADKGGIMSPRKLTT